MPFVHWLATVATVAITATSFAASAQEKPSPADPTSPDLVVTPFTYQSVFERYQTLKDEQTSPDETWRAANNEVKQLGGHAGHVKNVPPPAQAVQKEHGAHH